MAKDAITDFSETPSQNTDIGNISLLGSASPRVIKDYMPELMSQLASMNAGTAPLDDTFTRRDPDDTTKKYRADAGNIPTATTRVIDVEAQYQVLERGAIPSVITYYQSAGTFTHTFAEATKRFRLFLMGAGGDGGNVDGQGPGTGASASGGNSGNWGWTAYLTKNAIVSGTIVVGAAGTAVVTPEGTGCSGNDTTWSDGTNSYTVKGGTGGTGRQAGASYGVAWPSANSANTGTVYGTFNPGETGQGSANFNVAVAGGPSPYGTCLSAGMAFGAGVPGNAAVGNGSGGGGAAVVGVNTNSLGGRGAPGMIIVEEY